MKLAKLFPAALAWSCVLVAALILPVIAQAAGCPNEEFRTGPSASLPECRAYELVTPEELGRTQAITFTGSDHAIPSADGEHLALQTYAPLEPNPSLRGTIAVYTRTAQGWTATSILPPGTEGRQVELAKRSALDPELSQVAFASFTELNYEEALNAPRRIEVGPVGGPDTLVAEIPAQFGNDLETRSLVANDGTASVPPFTDVLFESTDHELLPQGPERKIAEETAAGAYDLYDWTEGRLRLVNVEGERSHVKPLNSCGASIGDGSPTKWGTNMLGAVSADGSKIFFTSCGGLYMRVDDGETVEISPGPANFNGATPDGSEVLFTTAAPLLPGETADEYRLFIYDTAARRVTFIASGISGYGGGTGSSEYLLSEDGSAVYYEYSSSIYRYDVQSGETSFVAAIHSTADAHEGSNVTPNGQFLLFASGYEGVEVAGPHGLEPEPRGVGHNEFYRYDAADGSVMCVSCGKGVAPAQGQMVEPENDGAPLETNDGTPPFIQMSETGQQVFFETTANLVPQDTNSTNREGEGGASGPSV